MNSQFCHGSATYFNDFISDADLHEFRMGGRKFMFYREEGHKFSKIDSFLVCPNFINQQPLSTVIALPREHLDHSPLILSNSNADFGPRLFRFFNSWMNMPSFNEVFDVA